MAVLRRREGAVLTLTIDRPDQRNSLNGEVLDGLVEGLRSGDGDPDVRVFVLTGAGDAFCAGADLAGGIGAAAEQGALARHEALGRIGQLFEVIDEVGKPLVGRINGHALAGGLGLALACDILVTADHATFGVPEVKRGLWPFQISVHLVDHLGPKRALELMMTGQRIDASTAHAWGLVNRVVPGEELDAAVGELTDRLVAVSPVGLRLGRRSFVAIRDMDRDAALAYLQGMLDLAVQTEDVVEGITAFFEKRDPEWPGR